MSQQPPPPPPPPIDPLILRRPPTAMVTPPPPPGPRRPDPPTGAPRRARRPPARRSKIASLALSVATTVGLTAAFARSGADEELAVGGVDSAGGAGGGASDAVGTVTDPSSVGHATPTTGPAVSDAGTDTTGTTGTSAVAIVDGTYTGETFTNRWGPVQVQVVYTAGSITDIVVLRYPDGDRKSVSINQRALPRFEASAIAAQSAAISRVSGATYTWRDYRRSLQTAIDAAIAASGSEG